MRATTVDELDDTVLECRTSGHDWDRKGTEWVWTRAQGGRAVEAVIRRTCRACGTLKEVVYNVHNGEFTRDPSKSRYRYPAETAYLLKSGEKGRQGVTRAVVMGVYAKRMYPKMKFA